MKNKAKWIKIAIAVVVTLWFWLVPPGVYGLDTISTIEQRMVAIFVFAAIMWMTEAIPIWTTSVVIAVLMLLTVSDSSFIFFRPGELRDLEALLKEGPLTTADSDRLAELQAAYGKAVSYKEILSTFADPTVMLFLGGFTLAIAATRTGLDTRLASAFLRPFGERSEVVMLGFMVVTAVFSMFMSNTATAAMMLAILAPVLRALPADGKGRIALVLAIAFAANIGGMGTPIGTPPNTIALKYLNDPHGLNMELGFGEWMLYMVPLVIVMIFIVWIILVRCFPFTQKSIHLNLPKAKSGNLTQKRIVYVTFAVTVLLWVLDSHTGLNSNVVAMIPVAVFCATGVIGREELKQINWDVLWLMAGGFALGVGMQKTGLAQHIVETIPFETWHPLLMIIGAGLLCYVMSTFMSNTATAALLIPILSTAAQGAGSTLQPYGGQATVLIGIAIVASLAMALPISTPPNALAHATGNVKQSQMAKAGIAVGIIGMLIAYTMLLYLGSVGMFSN